MILGHETTWISEAAPEVVSEAPALLLLIWIIRMIGERLRKVEDRMLLFETKRNKEGDGNSGG